MMTCQVMDKRVIVCKDWANWPWYGPVYSKKQFNQPGYGLSLNKNGAVGHERRVIYRAGVWAVFELYSIISITGKEG